MLKMSLGQVTIEVQNDDIRNEDIYCINGSQFHDSQLGSKLKEAIEHQVSEPERFIWDGTNQSVYTKQPDAVLELAGWLNQQQGVAVPSDEKERLRDKLIHLQQGEQYYY